MTKTQDPPADAAALRRIAEERLKAREQTPPSDVPRSDERLVHELQAMVGRELRMIELKEEINELCRRLGEPPRHASQESDQ